MVNPFEFSTSERIIFGRKKHREIVELASRFGKKTIIVSGVEDDLYSLVTEQLDRIEIRYSIFKVMSEPTIKIILEGVHHAKNSGCEFVIGIGGGSALDAVKAISAFCTNSRDVYDYLEIVGKGKPLKQLPIPVIAIPTTAGTGTEVTRNAVITVPFSDHPLDSVKVSLNSLELLPKIALIDPELTRTLPSNITAFTGMDALAQLIESYVSNRSNPITDAICLAGIRYAANSIQQAYDNGEDLQAREEMCIASLFGGMALSNARLGAVHGFAAPIGGYIRAAHGAICARLLPIVTEVNLRAICERDPNNAATSRYCQIARILTGDPLANETEGVIWLSERYSAMKILTLSQLGLLERDISIMVERASMASSMQGNPIKLTREEMFEILIRAL